MICSDVNVKERTIQIKKGGVACGQCRAADDAWRVLRFSALKLGPDYMHRESLARRLCLHLACVNKVPTEILGNDDLVVTWAQEIWSRAYALKVVLSGISGWRLLGPDGEAVERGNTGAAARLVEKLLSASRKDKSDPISRNSTAGTQLVSETLPSASKLAAKSRSRGVEKAMKKKTGDKNLGSHALDQAVLSGKRSHTVDGARATGLLSATQHSTGKARRKQNDSPLESKVFRMEAGKCRHQSAAL